MSFAPRSLFGRLVAVLLAGLVVTQLASFAIHMLERRDLLAQASGMQAAQRIADIVRLLDPLGQDERAKLAVAAGPQEARAQIVKSSDGTQLLQVKEPFDRAWRRVGLALDRVGVTVEARDRQNDLYFVRYADPESEMQKKDAERGLLSRIFSFGSSDPKVKAEQYRVQVKQEKETSMVNVLNKEGGAESSPTAQRILGLLHEQLK